MVKKTAQPDSPNREELFSMAMQAARNGNRQGAKVMLMQILREDRKNERAMLLLAKIASSKAERTQWLQRVLKINPQNETASSALAKMQHGETAARNQMLLRLGAGAYVIVVMVLAVLVVTATIAG